MPCVPDCGVDATVLMFLLLHAQLMKKMLGVQTNITNR
jgi:hypothetical protein